MGLNHIETREREQIKAVRAFTPAFAEWCRGIVSGHNDRHLLDKAQKAERRWHASLLRALDCEPPPTSPLPKTLVT